MAECKSHRTLEKREARYSPTTGAYVGSVPKTVSYCIGTKELDECNCGGDTRKCDFYPEKRKQKAVSAEADYKKLCEALKICEGESTSEEDCFECPLSDSDGVCKYSMGSGTLLDDAADAIEALQAECHNLQVHADYCESERDAYKDEVERLNETVSSLTVILPVCDGCVGKTDGVRNKDCTYEAGEHRLCIAQALKIPRVIRELKAENERLNANNTQLQAQFDMYGGDIGITAVYTENERLKKQLEAAMSDMKQFSIDWWKNDTRFPCSWCKYQLENGMCQWKINNLKSDGCYGRQFKWRGIQKEENRE